MPIHITDRLERMSDLLLMNFEGNRIGASLLLWEAAQYIRTKNETNAEDSRIYVSALSDDPDQ
jgi:hypothetical protein